MGIGERELRQNDYREPDDCCSWTHKSCGNLTILRSLRGRENRHGYRYTHIYVYIYIICANSSIRMLLSCSHPAEVQGVESRKPKANNEQARLNGGQEKLTSWRWELVSGKWEGRPSSSLQTIRSGHCVCHLAVALHSIWGQLGKLFAVCAGADRRHKKAREREVRGARSPSLLSLSAEESGAMGGRCACDITRKNVRCSVPPFQTCDCERVVYVCE